MHYENNRSIYIREKMTDYSRVFYKIKATGDVKARVTTLGT
jgi:hypothetical protein